MLPGTAFDLPDGTQYLSPFDAGGPNPLFLSVYSALSANPSATFQWATAAKLPFVTEAELGNAALYVVGFLVRYTDDFIERVNGKMPFDNEEVAYQVNVTPDPATNAYLSGLLNAGVERFKADRPALPVLRAQLHTDRRDRRPVDDVAYHARSGHPVLARGDVRRDGRGGRAAPGDWCSVPSIGGTLRVHLKRS